VFVVAFVADVDANIVQERRVLQQFALAVGQASIIRVWSKSSVARCDLLRVFRPVVAALGELNTLRRRTSGRSACAEPPVTRDARGSDLHAATGRTAMSFAPSRARWCRAARCRRREVARRGSSPGTRSRS
jgi:hypothetical protein